MTPSVTCRRIVARNIYIHGEEPIISENLPNRLFDK